MSVCQDYTGRPISDGTFFSNQYKGCIVANGTAVSKPTGGIVETYIYDNVPIETIPGTGIGNLVPPSGWQLDLVARTNPNRPVLTPLTLMQDFIEIPGALRDLGKLLTKPAKSLGPKDLANQYLALQFGWLPLVEDVRQLLDLQSYTLRRVRELNKLYSGPGLRRSKITFGEENTSTPGTTRISVATGAWVDLQWDVSVHKKMWGSIHWKPSTVPVYLPSDRELNRLARRIVLGLTPEGLAKGAWDIIPWTWLIGYFTNVGKSMLAAANTVPCYHSNMCIMSETKVTVSPKSSLPVNCAENSVATGGSASYVSKTRQLSTVVSPGFNMPFLDVFRLSILGSLTVQRIPR